MENVKFKRCVISDVSYGCGLLTLTVNTKGFKRYSTGLRRIREVLENTFCEHHANMLLTEFWRAEDNSFDDDSSSFRFNTVRRGGHSYFGAIACKYVVDFYYSSCEHIKGDIYGKSMTCVFSVYLRDDTSLSDVLLSNGLLSGLFAEDTTEDTKDTTEDTKDTTEDTKDTTEDTKDTTEDTKDTKDTTEDTKDTKDTTEDTKDTKDTTTIILGALDSVQVKRSVVKPVPFSSSFLEVRTGGEYPFIVVLPDGSKMWDCRQSFYNAYLCELLGALPDGELPF